MKGREYVEQMAADIDSGGWVQGSFAQGSAMCLMGAWQNTYWNNFAEVELGPDGDICATEIAREVLWVMADQAEALLPESARGQITKEKRTSFIVAYNDVHAKTKADILDYLAKVGIACDEKGI
jgi:hypothetical protein